jgi:hypothetical protein
VTAPALVLHRRGDRTVPLAHGRELASLLPNARLVTLSGNAHLPWLDDNRETFRALTGFLDDAPPVDPDADSPLTRRETEVMRLVASGCRTATSPRRSSSANTRCIATSRTSCASSPRAHARERRRMRRGSG